ncbi:MAG TPA: glycosyltransferase family 4 protein [Candidatus Sumerlaeota bacterium]|nr:glycosyltransferase family 4 protein [Candidatus Sumerlaeota bacterium]
MNPGPPPLRVLVVTNMYPTPAAPYYGVFVKEQVDALRELGVEAGLEIHLGRESKWNYARGLASLTRRLRRERWDLIHSHHTFTTLTALAARRLAGRGRGPRRIPIIESFHEGEVFDPRGRWRGHLRHSAWLKALALRRADFVLPVEKNMIRAALAAAGAADAEVEAERIPHQVLPAGIDLERFGPGDAQGARRRLGWDGEGPLLFFPYAPGKPAKRDDLARAAFAIVRRTHPGAQLVVGGAIPYAAMPDAIRASDVLLILTDYEASPTIVKEALACERPVVATDVGDIRACYGDLPGVVVTPAEPEAIASGIDRALALPAGSACGGRERLIARGLTLPATARRLVEVYRELI